MGAVITGLVWLAVVFPAQAEVLLRVGVAVERASILLGSSTSARILDDKGNVLEDLPPMTPLQATGNGRVIQLDKASGSRLFVQPTSPDGLVFIGNYWYRGLIELVPDNGGLTAINRVGLEDYVSSVIGSEMGHRFPTEALKAQAVASRTYALFQRSSRLNALYDLGDDQTWQVYKGIAAESNRTQEAAKTTLGQVLTYNGRLINAVFHSSSGGHTDNSEEVWTEALPYLRGVEDYDVAAPVFSWTKTFSAQALQSLANGIGSVIGVDVVERSSFGRAKKIQLRGTQGTQTITAAQLRRALQLRSTLFAITPMGGNVQTASLGPSKAPSQFSIQGRGFGHGVGMSQWGASGLAGQGWNYQQILVHYYQNSALAMLDPQ